MTPNNVDSAVAEDFGREWNRFQQDAVPSPELTKSFDEYFSIFPWSDLPPNAVGFDAGCGSGRWAAMVAPRVGTLHCVDAAAEALAVAQTKLTNQGQSNCHFHHCSVGDMPFADDSMDFAYSLGVLHHIPDTAAGVASCARKLKAGAPFLLYLYYSLEDRPWWFRAIFHGSDIVRRLLCRMPHAIKCFVSDLAALLIYWPLSRMAGVVEKLTGRDVDGMPLAAYRDKSFYTLRTDALDRLGTRLERRFNQQQMREMMTAAGLTDIRFSDHRPFWCAVGIKS